MPTNYSDQFFIIDPFAPPAAGTALNFENRVLTDNNDDFDIQAADGDTIDGIGIDLSWPDDTVTINVPGVGNVTYTGITFYLSNGERVFTPTDGQVLQNGTFVSSTAVSTTGPLPTADLGPPCFTLGTVIATPDGPKAIEDLQVGELVHTLDHGPQLIRWIGMRRIAQREIAGNSRLRPILIPAGAMGAELPVHDLLVSRQHRLLVRSKIAQRMFGKEEVLVPAIKLVGTAGISEVEVTDVTYIHLLFDQHEVVFAHGLPSESLFTGPIALSAVGPDASKEIRSLFPDISMEGNHAPARELVDNGRGRRLAERHATNKKPYLDHSILKSLPKEHQPAVLA